MLGPNRSRKIRITIVAADSLIKRDLLRLPDPFAIVSVDGEQIHTTSVIKKTLNPYWNENFDITVKDSSVVAVQIFDQRKFKRKVRHVPRLVTVADGCSPTRASWV